MAARADPFEIAFHPHAVSVEEQSEGYRVFRCLPATWSYEQARPIEALAVEFNSARMAVDPYGVGLESDFWSGSDCALRLRSLQKEDLALRELTAQASRRSTGINAPKPWASLPEVEHFAESWRPGATDIHFSQYPVDAPSHLWERYGMEKSEAQPVIFSYGMRESLAPPLGREGIAWDGGPGTWYAWSTVVDWDRWPRRQEAEGLSSSAVPGKLLLFVSHRWTSLEHPDPQGTQLLALKVGLTLALAEAVLRVAGSEEQTNTTSGLPDLIAEFMQEVLGNEEDLTRSLKPWARRIRAAAKRIKREKTLHKRAKELESPEYQPALDALRERILIWYDYASMFQSPRSSSEEDAFRSEILDLNHIQANAGTLVIADDDDFMRRAWCFLEVCGGIRNRIVELTPSWGRRVGVGGSVTRWAARSDQLIGALKVHGLEALQHAGLRATHPEDLADIARLLSRLPLTGAVETDESDLIGGSLPTPFRSGAWRLPEGKRHLEPSQTLTLAPLTDYGLLPSTKRLQLLAERHADPQALTTPVGVWVYSTQRSLTLAWAARAGEIWRMLRAALVDGGQAEVFGELLEDDIEPAVACLWADARSLAEDGQGWTRATPSTVHTLVIVTQVDIPELCLIYPGVVASHLAEGVPVVCYSPETGRTLLYRPRVQPIALADNWLCDVLAVPRLRRPDTMPSRMFLPAGATLEEVQAMAALRLDPWYGPPGIGALAEEAAAVGLGSPGEEITLTQMVSCSEQRVRVEGLARSAAATWDEWCAPRVGRSAWETGMASLQLQIIEQLVRKAISASDNPLERRRLLRLLVEDHEDYALPPYLLEDADEFLEMIREELASEG